MRHLVLLVLALTLVAAAPAVRHGFVLTSSDLKPGKPIANAQVYKGMGCEGGNVSPVLLWRGAPAGTKSFALTVYDPDAPTGSGWWHWVVYDIPPGVNGLPADAGDASKHLLPEGAKQGNTDFGTKGYGGPCPPPKDKPHRYVFTVYALDVDRLDVPENATAAYVGFNLHAHTLGKAVLTARYGRGGRE